MTKNTNKSKEKYDKSEIKIIIITCVLGLSVGYILLFSGVRFEICNIAATAIGYAYYYHKVKKQIREEKAKEQEQNDWYSWYTKRQA